MCYTNRRLDGVAYFCIAKRRTMNLYEHSWHRYGKTYARIYDTKRNKSLKIASKHKSEYFKEDPKGEYKSFLDKKPLKKVQGSAWDVQDAYGILKGDYALIRDEFFKDSLYNVYPSIFYIDIETAVSSYKYNDAEVLVRKKEKNELQKDLSQINNEEETFGD